MIDVAVDQPEGAEADEDDAPRQAGRRARGRLQLRLRRRSPLSAS